MPGLEGALLEGGLLHENLLHRRPEPVALLIGCHGGKVVKSSVRLRVCGFGSHVLCKGVIPRRRIAWWMRCRLYRRQGWVGSAIGGGCTIKLL